MHCPNCRHDNPSTTRFCNACGAVLVEDAPGVGRRRVLRPWGLRRSAPLTISPDIDAPQAPHPPRCNASVHLDLVLAASVIVAIIGATALFPRSMASDATPQAAAPAATASEAVTTIVVPPLHTTSMSAPALVEPAIAPRRPAAAAPPRKPKEAVRSPPAPVVVSVAVEPVEAPAVEVPPAPPPPPPVAPAPRDRWDGLRDALSACELQTNVLDRAMCEQGARIQYCTQLWDLVELCPSGRPAITQ